MNNNMDTATTNERIEEVANLTDEQYEKEIVSTLVSMYQAISVEDRNKHYNNLCHLAENKGRFLQGIVKILYGQYEVQQKLSVVLYFKSYMNNLIIKKSLSPIERKEVFWELLKVSFECDLQTDVRNNLSPCLESLLFADESDHLDSQHLLDLMFETMGKYIGDNPREQDGRILRVFFSLYKVSTNIIQDVNVLSEKLRSYNKVLWSGAMKVIEDLRVAFTNGDIESAKMYSSSIFDWTMIYKDTLNKIQRGSKGLSFIDFMTREDFMNVVYIIIFLSTEEEKIFFTTGDDKVDSYLYMAKEYVIKIIGQLISYIKPHLHMKALKDTDFIKLLQEITPKFLKALINLGSDSENYVFLENAKRKQCVSSVLTALAQLVYIKDYHNFFLEYGMRLFTDIGFPFLRTLEDEKAEAIDNPNEFINLALDVCDRQRMYHVKSQAARFIETMADKLPNVFGPLCNLCWDLLGFSVFKEQGLNNQAEVEQLASNYPTLKDNYAESKFFTYGTNEDWIDISMIVLTMVSYALPKDETLKERFTEILEKVTEPIMLTENLILNCRLTCLLGYYIDILYKEDNLIFNKVIKMFITSLNQNEENHALALQSSDTLNTIINDNDIVPRIKPIINELLFAVNDAILTVKIPHFFEFLEEIFKYYKDDILKENVVICVNYLVKRIENDVTNNKGKSWKENPFQQHAPGPIEGKDTEKIENTISIQKCWGVIMRILETGSYVENFGVELINELKILFGGLVDPSRIDFDDDIVKSMKICINKTKHIDDVMKTLFGLLGNTFKKYKYIYPELFDLIKAYIKTDKAFIFSDPNNIQMLFGYGVETVYNEHHTINGAIYLIQLLLLLKDDVHTESEAVIPELLSQVLKRMEEQPMNRALKRILFGVILASMVSNYKTTFEYFEAHNMTENIIDQALKYGKKSFSNSLERKLYSMSLTSLLTQPELPDVVRDKSPQIIKMISEILITTSKEEAKIAKKKQNQKINHENDSDYDSEFDSFSDSDESDEEEDENLGQRAHNIASLADEENKNAALEDHAHSTESEGEEENELLESEIDINSAFSTMKTGFNSFDEFNYFTLIWKKLSANHPQEMQTLLTQLGERTQNSIISLIQTKTFERNGHIMHRRIVKGKRKK